ncbi:hypothetical protein D915_009382 [Fasciola hepatica]|uniref:Uncharacterized protein n=1 Tax=Fasciola hepatica TaxID=6192 RepID=A0A4E0R1C3_FASHE|nr:hypothetical protein D915_009382 [Fasciola hepatica]
MAALGGLLFAPLSKCSGYMTFMSFMVTTAVGSLFSSALLVLVPEALNLSSFESYVPNGHKKWYLPITIAICGGSFLFFTIEFILRRIRAFLESRSSKRDSLGTTNSMAVTNGCCIPVLAGKRNYSDFPYRLREPVAHGDQVAENPRVNPRLSDHDSHKPAALLTNEVDKNHHQQSEKSGCCASRVSLYSQTQSWNIFYTLLFIILVI